MQRRWEKCALSPTPVLTQSAHFARLSSLRHVDVSSVAIAWPRRHDPGMSGGALISEEAAAIKRTIAAAIVDPQATVESDRRTWIEGVADAVLAVGTDERLEQISGVPCRWVSPIHSDDLALIVYGHGGGLVSGSSVTHREFASRLALATQCRVLLVDYRLLPEHGIGDAIADIASVYRRLVARSTESPSRIVFGGDSSGAALMVSALIRLRDEGDQLPAGLISFSGAFDATLSSASVDEGRDPQLSRDVLEHWQAVIRRVADLDDPRLSPVFAELRGLPPVLLLAGSDEVWRDDSVRLGERLVAGAGVVELAVANGMWHVWPMWGSFPEATAALERAAAFVRACCTAR